MINAAGRKIADFYPGYGPAVPFKGAFAYAPELHRAAPHVRHNASGKGKKVISSLKEVFQAIPIRDGMTLSFHHHLRNGDAVIKMVCQTAAELGIKDLTIASSGLFPVHSALDEYIRKGVITSLDSSGIMGSLAHIVMDGKLPSPAIVRTHGGRARAIECGQIKIDVAFIAAPVADAWGNATGMEGRAAFGSIGYAIPDAQYAENVVIVTDDLREQHLSRFSIPQTLVDYVVPVPSIGDPAGIATGAIRWTKDPIQLQIARDAVKVVDALGLIRDGYSFQTGTGGISLAYTRFLAQLMGERGVKGGFAVGGITTPVTQMLENGLLQTLFDVQSFDLGAVQSIARNAAHLEMSAGYYASPFNSGCIVNDLDTTIISALEIDRNFNINVLTGNDGAIMAGVGGNPDTAAGANVTIVVSNLLRGRMPSIVDNVHTICTPGETVDVLVTDYGVAVNPRRSDIIDGLNGSGLELHSIDELQAIAETLCGKPKTIPVTDKVVAVVEYRDGTIIDTVHQVAH